MSSDMIVHETNNEKIEEQSVLTSLFTGGFNSHTYARLTENVIKRSSSPSSSCAINGCDGKLTGNDTLPCECDFEICRDCYKDALRTGGAICPGCKYPYKITDLNCELWLPVKLDRCLSNSKCDFDANEWLLETTNATYGYGNAMLPEKKNDGPEVDDNEFTNKQPWRPLTRKLNIPSAIISPYRLLILSRMVALGLFLQWRVRNPNRDAIWLWGMSVVCEIWFAFSWILDQIPKFCPVNRATDLNLLIEKFENPTSSKLSDLPGIDVFVSTADPDKEPPLVTANTILSILAADYPVEKLACYVSDDGGALLTFEAMAEAASFANLWVPFCRKHCIEPRNPESYFALKTDPLKNKFHIDFVKNRRRVKREYDEFKVRINRLPDSIRSRSDGYHAAMKEKTDEKATWMADGSHWPGTWLDPIADHMKGDHAGIIKVIQEPPQDEPLFGTEKECKTIDLTGIDVRLPMLVYISREKRPGYDHNKKAGAMNALVRASAIMSNGPFILNLDCDHYVYNSQAMREGMCFMMDRGGDKLCFVQFPQRFEGIDPSDRYANRNTVFFDSSMRALDGLQGPVYVGTGCLFRRVALYGFNPPRSKEHSASFFGGPQNNNLLLPPTKFGNSCDFIKTIKVAESQGRPLADHPSVKNGRPSGDLAVPRKILDGSDVFEAVSVISSWYEDNTDWGQRAGWIYGSVTEDVVTGYRMHNRGWRSAYCVTKRDAFRGTAPINLTDRLHQVLRWATGSVEIFFSRNNALLASSKMKVLQRLAYLNVGIYPFTSVFLIVYCFLPAFALFSGQFIVQTLSVEFLVYLLFITITLCALAVLEMKWSSVNLEDWWRNEQFWLIGGTSAHLAAVFQGLLKIIARVEISFTLTSKSAGDEEDDGFADLYLVKWSGLMIPPIVIIMVNVIAIAAGVSRAVNSVLPQWSRLIGGVFFSFWVLAHFYPFAKGLLGRRGRIPTIVYVWSGLIAIIISLMWAKISPTEGIN